MKNLLVGQSGGPTAVINCSLSGVIKNGLESPEIGKVFGAVNGIDGVLNGNLADLERFKDPKLLDILKQTPSSYLGSCRIKLPDLEENEEPYINIFKTFKKYDIGFFFYIGGNDSMDTVSKLSRYAKEKNINDIFIVGIPKTIDNDLCLTDHTPGFGSAAKFIANSIRQLALDTQVYKLKSAVVVEIMGRNAGWLTAAASLANSPDFNACQMICLPEVAFDEDKFLAKLDTITKEHKSAIIAVSEGIKNADGSYIGERSIKKLKHEDHFNHAALGGVGKLIEHEILTGLGLKTRTIEFSTLQRCYSLGASLCDIKEAFMAGFQGVEFAKSGMTGIMPGFKRISDTPYEMEIVPLDVNKVANFEKTVPLSWLTDDRLGVNAEFEKYAKPLICGEPTLLYENGVMDFTTL